jgi:hypothetical protein
MAANNKTTSLAQIKINGTVICCEGESEVLSPRQTDYLLIEDYSGAFSFVSCVFLIARLTPSEA